MRLSLSVPAILFSLVVSMSGTVSAADGCNSCQPAVAGGYVASYGGTYAVPPSSCPPWRPCGPGNSWGGNRGMAQGFYGADFRPACANHDACLAAGMSRKECDRQFLAQMQYACANSSDPEACMRKAKKYYVGERQFGWLYR